MFVWLTSLCMVLSRFIRVTADGKISLLSMAEEYSLAYMHVFIHSSVSGHLGCFHVEAVVNTAVVNIKCVYLFEL